MITCIKIKNINFETSIGCIPEEREKTTMLICNVKLKVELDFGADEQKDELENSVDYRQVLYALLETSSKRHYNLLESFGESASKVIADISPLIKEVELEIAKPGALPGGAIPEITVLYSKR